LSHNCVRFVSAFISDGIVLEREFPNSRKFSSEELRAEIWDGMGPDSLLLDRSKLDRIFSANTSEGIDLERKLLKRFMLLREELR
jgi:hypothetical protein